jgi:hypothetical protein
MRNFLLSGSLFVLLFAPVILFSQSYEEPRDGDKLPEGYRVKTYIDNQGYWKRMARYGLAELNPYMIPEPAVYKGSAIQARTVTIEDSEDVPVTNQSGTQSENSAFVNPEDIDNVLNSNNSTGSGSSFYGADGLYTFDGGESWEGAIQGTGGSNQGDPSVIIGLDGTYYNNFINNSNGQSIAISTNQGETWTAKIVASPSGILDKNHMWIDNTPSSPYEGNLYVAWMASGGVNADDIEITRSTDGGNTWGYRQNISAGANAGSHNQGVNIQTGPNGEVYAVWAVYDNWPGDEKALGFAKSTDGGVTFNTAVRIINNIKGIRNTGVNKDHRVNSFPSMTVDLSNGPRRGYIYVVWTNVGIPGTNQGPDVDVYMIRSVNGGTDWSDPIKINQDAPGNGKKHYFGWITCDPVTGTLSAIFYDDRNVSGGQVETWAANSLDGGLTWEDFRVSDVAFTPHPIPGLASGYMGDYLSITAKGGLVYPCWTDNRTGTAMTYVSPYETAVEPSPAIDPDPSDGAANVVPFTPFSWVDDGGRSTEFKLFLGTNNPPSNILNGVSIYETHFYLEEDLDYQEQYFWKIKSLNSYGEAESETWSFSVENQPDEDFESGSFNNNDWTFAGDADWIMDNTVSRNGLYAARSGAISNSQSTSLMIELEVMNTPFATSISFWKKVSSQTGGDKLQFLIDGEVKAEWSGENDWTEENHIVSTGGFHTFEWKYIKDANGSTGLDAAWIDYIKFPLLEELTANAGPNATICEGSMHQLEGHSNNYTSLLWATSGDGSFDNTAILEPTYTPGISDITNGSVTLTLTASDETEQVSDYMELTIQQSPSVEMQEEGEVCEGTGFSLENVTAGNYASLLWTSTGDGQFDDNTLLNPVYTPGTMDIETGSVTLTLTAAGFYPCPDLSSALYLTVNHLPGAALQPSGPEVICQNSEDTEYLTDTISGATEYDWQLLPPEAGDVTGNGITALVDWREDFAGIATLSVWGINECGEGALSPPFNVTVNPLPVQAATPSGEEYVCVNFVSSSDYQTTGADHATSYEWSIQPEEAGTISGTDLIATVTWNQWEGIANIAVQGMNECGVGIWSGSLEVETDICTGIEKSDNRAFIIYPNPSTDGHFRIVFADGYSTPVRLKITNAADQVIIEKNLSKFKGLPEYPMNLKNQPKGVYFVIITLDNKEITKKVILQ